MELLLAETNAVIISFLGRDNQFIGRDQVLNIRLVLLILKGGI